MQTRHDSDDDVTHWKERRTCYDSDSDSDASTEGGDNDLSTKKMSSGHSAGLQSTSQFRNAEASLQEKRLKEAKKIAQQDGGRSNELCIATSMAEH